MIRDENTLQDILGAIYSAQMDLASETPEFDPYEQIAKLIERIEEKERRNRNKVQAAWLQRALSEAREAVEVAKANRQQADQLLSKCAGTLEQGNKINRRSTNFVVGPDGQAKPIG